jgi:DNA repair protein RadC
MEIRLSKLQKTKIKAHEDVYEIMRMVLMREQKIDRNREHLWVIGLAADNTILLVELVSMGSVTRTIAEPMEIFSLALQKRCVKIILVHNHPSGLLKPSAADKDMTDRMIQVGRIVHVPVLDHYIISEQGYFSFLEDGLMDDLAKSLKYVPEYEQVEREVEVSRVAWKRSGAKDKSREMARAMKASGYPVAEIMRLTGLSKAAVQRLKAQ